MNIIVRTPLMADKIKNLLDGNTFHGMSFVFIDKKGMEMTFRVSGDSIEGLDVISIVKNAIKATDYGKGIYFSVIKG